MDFQPPPYGEPDKDWVKRQNLDIFSPIRKFVLEKRGRDSWVNYLPPDLKICMQYCEDETTEAKDWHTHIPPTARRHQEGTIDFFGFPPRTNPDAPFTYNHKPVVYIVYHGALAVGLRMSTKEINYRLPTEAEWEKGARGGLVGMTYAWGDTLPTHDNCDFGRFEELSIQKSKSFPPNGYGLYAMCGGVWEWTSDWYDAEYYTPHLHINPTGSEKGEAHVLRGGSWADDAEAVTVSYRMAEEYHTAATVGFRLCRVKTIG